MGGGFRHGRRTAALGGVLVAGAAAVLWWNSGSGPLSRGIDATADCAAGAPVGAPGEPARTDAADHLVPVLPVPVGPVGATLCRYSGPQGGLEAGLRLDATRTAEVAGWLDALPAAPGESPTCPGDASDPAVDTATGPVDLVTFGYREGAEVTVAVRHGPCVAASNGVLTATDGPALTARFDELVDAAG